jgi:SAM-dependent methyltransferase
MDESGRESAAVLRPDFDRIAALDDEWDHNQEYHGALLRALPPRIGGALDIGCGKGLFTRRLAERADRVVALALSERMIAAARARLAGFANIAYAAADVRTWSWPTAPFDCIAGIATLHHLPLRETLRRCAEALAPGGTLLLLDLYRAAEPADCLAGAIAFAAAPAWALLHHRRIFRPEADRLAWAEHGTHEHDPALAEIRRIVRDVLPGAEIRRRLFWRYTLVWRKPAG